MKKQVIILALTVTLAACATVNETYSSNGKKAYTLNCSGAARGWDKCLQAAGEKCGSRGYKVLDKSSEETASVHAGSSGGVFDGTSFMRGSKNHERSMLIECK